MGVERIMMLLDYATVFMLGVTVGTLIMRLVRLAAENKVEKKVDRSDKDGDDSTD